MTEDKILRFYLDAGLKDSAEAGRHNFIGKVAQVARNAGLEVEFCGNSLEERLKSAERGGYAMFHMDDPLHDRALTMRRVYYYPFWQIEQSAKRWEWRVAKTPFPAADINRDEADRFFAFWRKRLFDAPNIRREGFVYVPLQGRLCEQRSFQSCAPIDMIEAVLRHEPDRRVIATLHPNEAYAPEELAALEALTGRHDRLSIATGGMEAHLAGCDYVASQNSSAAFAGFFFEKPCVLFGQIDFHHIAANVADLGVAEAFRQVRGMTPDYAGYLWWFLQVMAINAGRADAEEKIRAALQRGGWPV